ncbi:protein kinase [Actinomadura sp. LOL_016]|uniref:protein kinase domain-containing protein n=1 Tax=unclassified Actinomadura TaxID=2626254 RepID=UPI003A8040A4
MSTGCAHPHVLTPYASCAADGDVLLAMDLVRGGPLQTLLGDYGRLPPAYTAEVLDQMLAALSHIHGAGVVHRDVKPADLLLEPSPVGAPHVRLADFGVALEDDGMRVTTTGFTVGTPGYLAPEGPGLEPSGIAPGPLRRRDGRVANADRRGRSGAAAAGGRAARRGAADLRPPRPTAGTARHLTHRIGTFGIRPNGPASNVTDRTSGGGAGT